MSNPYYGIITHYDVHNHGAVLQLNALCRVLRSRYALDASALRFDKNYDFLGHRLKAKYEPGLRSLGIYLKYLREQGLRCLLYNWRKRRTLERFKRTEGLVGDYYTEGRRPDGVVVGSDEVFALHTGPTPVLFGHALPAEKVFAYAGTFGPTTHEDIDRLHCRPLVESGLAAMKGIGVRDANTERIVLAMTGVNTPPSRVCDPVLLYGYEQELRQAVRPCREKYMVIYAYDRKMNDPAEVERIRRFAREQGWRIVSPGYWHAWADRNVDVDPVGLLAWFRFAECVVTDTFHGAVMSIITGRELAVRLRDNANKLLNLLEEYRLTDRLIGDDWDLTALFARPADWAAVNAEVERRRAESLRFLDAMVAD